MRSLTTLALLAAVAVPTLAQAQATPLSMSPSFYLGADALIWNSKVDGLPNYDAAGARLRGGVSFNEYLAIEGHAATGGSDDSTGGIEHDLNHAVGLFVRATTPIQPDFRLYGLVGYADVSMDHSNPFLEGDIEDSGFAYGVGIEVNLMENANLFIEGTRYLDNDDHTFETLGGGVRYVF
jgi:opacity protein-like surface antigen